MNPWVGKVALVTGASSGIGYEITKQLASCGMTVVGCAMNISKIEELSSTLSSSGQGKIFPVVCDVRKEEDIKSAFQTTISQFGGVDVCVNNAGLMHKAPLLSGSTADWRDMLEVNVLGLCVCTREFVLQLKERNVDCGHIININSISAHKQIKVTNSGASNMYAATKHAVKALTEGVRQELREMNSNVRVTSISPGIVRTEFRARVSGISDPEERERSKVLYDSLPGEVGEVMEPGDIASAILYVLSSPPRVQVHDMLVRPTTQIQ